MTRQTPISARDAAERQASGRWTRRDFLRTSGLSAAAVAVGGLAACTRTTPSGGGGGALEQARQSGTIKVGIAGELPYGYTDKSGKLTGQAPEVARAVFNSIGIRNIDATQVDFGQLIPALNARQFDMVAAGMDITPARCKNAAFSIPDYVAPAAFLVPKGNPQQVLRFEDVTAKGLKLAVETGTVEQTYAQQLGVPQQQTLALADQNALLQAVVQGRVYAAVLTNISLLNAVKENPGAPVEVTPAFTPVIDGKPQIEVGGFVFRKADADLLNAFNTGLKTLHDNGQWLRIVEPFGFTKDNLPGPEVSTEQLCAG